MENEIIRQGYNRIGSDYHVRRYARTDANKVHFDELIHYFPDSGRLLDLCCGSGVPVAKYFRDHGFEITGIDISEVMIKIAREQIPDGDFQLGDMSEVDFDEGAFDLIVSTYAIIHVRREKQEALFRNIHRWLRPGGRTYLVLGDADQPAVIKEDWHGVQMYWSYYSPETYDRLFLKIGFRKVWSEEVTLSNGERFYNIILEKIGS